MDTVEKDDPGQIKLMNESGTVPMAVDKIQFSLMSPKQMADVAVMKCDTEELYTVHDGFVPVPGGVLDLRLGTSNKDRVCQTCGEKLKSCTGHFGSVDLCLPVFHTGYFKQTLNILQSICKTCSRNLLPAEDRKRFLAAMRRKTSDHFLTKLLVKQVLEKCKKCKTCPWCGAANGTVKKSGYLQIVHERHKPKVGPDEKFVSTFAEAVKQNEELAGVIHKAHDDLHPLRARQLLERIPDEDCELLDMHPDYGRPEQLIWTRLPCPPACIRPSVGIDASNSNEDDLTMWMMKIIECSKQLAHSLAKGTWKFDHIMACWMHHPFSLQVLCAQYINGDTASMPQAIKSMQSIRGLCQRMKGKQGRFRAHLQGKRVDFTSRTVISPDPNLKIEQVGLPQRVCKMLTFPERVFDRNIEKIRQLVRNGPKLYPGANAIEFAEGPRRSYLHEKSGSTVLLTGRFDLRHGDRAKVADQIRPGDVVERHLADEDVVLFNRQPSLHRLSIMAHRVKVLAWRTFRFNECVCGPYNADFDGDEMNVHVPQTVEAVTEAMELMGVHRNLVTPRNGEPLIAATQDFITASYLLTRKDVFADRGLMCQFCTYMCDGLDDINLPPPAILKPQELWTGKQIFSMLLNSRSPHYSGFNEAEKGLSAEDFAISGTHLDPSYVAEEEEEEEEVEEEEEEEEEAGGKRKRGTKSPRGKAKSPRGKAAAKKAAGGKARTLTATPRTGGNINKTCYVNLQTKERSYEGQEHMDPADGWVVIEQSEIICGQLGKKTLGDGTKSGMIYTVLSHHGSEMAAKFMARMAKLTTRWLTNFGFTIGLDDVEPSPNLIEKKTQAVTDGYEKCQVEIKKFKEGTLEMQPGSTPEETLEEVLQSHLNQVRNTCGDVCFASLSNMNKTVVMAQSGSKGSNLNISQMVAALGQQVVSGSRVPDGFTKRSLPHFPVASKEPEAKGFVANSFYTGLTATEFFFHTMGGREGLVDTAVKTADTGYLQRRMVKTLEDVSIEYDGTVRDSKKNIVQFSYGGDGLDPILMESDESTPLNFERELHGVRCAHPYRQTGSPALLPWEITNIVQQVLFPDLAAAVVADSEAVAKGGTTTAGATLVAASVDLLHGNVRDISGDNPLPESNFSLAGRLHRLVSELKFNDLQPKSAYLLSVVRFMEAEAERIAKLRESYKLPAARPPVARPTPPPEDSDSDGDLDLPDEKKGPPTGEQERLCLNITHKLRCVTKEVLKGFLQRCANKYDTCAMEPGTAVGAIVAQSIGEPATQMTLKTFHFAGVASMNVTMGVPRIKELMDATKAVKTPIITAELEVGAQDSELSARYIRARIERTMLGEICKSISEVFDVTTCYVQIKLDLATIKLLNLENEVNCEVVREALVKESKLKLKKAKLIQHDGRDTLRVWPPDDSREKLLFQMQTLKNALPKVVVCGIHSVNRAVVVKKEKPDKGVRATWNLKVPRYCLLIEGRDMAHVKSISGVDGTKTSSNHIVEVESVLGIEASRVVLIDEVLAIMGAYDIGIDRRHVELVADIMTTRGTILGINRFGLQHMKESVLMLASFEKTTEFLFDAAVHAREDAICGVSECITLGIPVNLGTGSFRVVFNPTPEKGVTQLRRRFPAKPLLLGHKAKKSVTFGT